MKYDPHWHHRRSIRLKGFDYASRGAYFVTICVQDMACVFGRIHQSTLIPTPAAEMVYAAWLSIPDKFPDVELGAFIIMPNHIHFILWLVEPEASERDFGSTRGSTPTSLSEVVRWFKSLTTAKYTKGVREAGWPNFRKRFWQRNYYEKIMRNDKMLHSIQQYIATNPENWQKDSLHPNAPPNKFNTMD